MPTRCIKLIFENLEYIIIPERCVESMDMVYNVSEGVLSRWNLQAESLLLTVKDFSDLRTNDDTPLYDRIRSRDDITCVSLNLADGACEDYNVKWEGSDTYNNILQVYTLEDNLLTIKIGEK